MQPCSPPSSFSTSSSSTNVLNYAHAQPPQTADLDAITTSQQPLAPPGVTADANLGLLAATSSTGSASTPKPPKKRYLENGEFKEQSKSYFCN